jgi:ATP-dependent exoDNAse (exonuclease V) beta subunit
VISSPLPLKRKSLSPGSISAHLKSLTAIPTGLAPGSPNPSPQKSPYRNTCPLKSSSRSLHPKREAPSTHAHRLFSDPPEFGIRLHELAATLDRPGISENIRRLDELKPTDPITREARDALLQLLHSETGPRLFEPEDGTTIWIEKAFAWNSPDGFVKGRWDRVHLVQDASGRPQEATLFDFKTDRDSSQLKERYTPQMEAYRRALAAVTHLPIEKVHGHLVHVPSCSLINL